MKKILFIASVTFLFTTATFSQTKFDIPQNVKLEAPADFETYENDVVNAATWLEETDLDKDKVKRREVNTFVLQWLTGSPTVTVEVSEPLIKLYDKNEQLLGLYLASYAKYNILNKTNTSKFEATKAAIVSMIKVYKKGIDIVKNKEMEKAVKLFDQGKIDDYIKSKL
ncbi:hypothetical protein [Flavobacterium sp. GCM10023249]|uniref:hypothetical protein n=1 Tax=unclassified Flavobacterium TaxID=196869 RepID=UPI003623A9C0